MTRGVVFASLKQGLKQQGCSLQNEIIIDSVSVTIIAIQNNSDVDVIIPLCFVSDVHVK